MEKNNIILDSESLQKRAAELGKVLRQVESVKRAKPLKKQRKKASELRQALSVLPAFSLEPKQLVENLKENLKIETETRLISIEKNFKMIKERLIHNFKFDLEKELLQFGASIGIQEKVQYLEREFQNACSKELDGYQEKIHKRFNATLHSCDYILQIAELPDGEPYLDALKIAEDYLNIQKQIEELNQILSAPSNLWIDDTQQNWLTEDTLLEAEEVLLPAKQVLKNLNEQTDFLEEGHRKATDLQQVLAALQGYSLEPKQVVKNLRKNWKTRIKTQLRSIEKNFEGIKEHLIHNFKFDLGKELLPFSASTKIQEILQHLEWKFQNACGRELEGCKDAISQQFEATLLSCNHILQTAEPLDGQPYLDACKIAGEYLNVSKESVNSQRQGGSNLHNQLVQQISDIENAVEMFKKDNEYREVLERQKVQIDSNAHKENLLNLFGKNGQAPYARLGFKERVNPKKAEDRAWEWLDDWELLRSVDIYSHAVSRLGQLIEILEAPDNNA